MAIEYTTIIENGAVAGEKYNSLKYQLLRNADGQSAMLYPAYLSLTRPTERSLTDHIQDLVPHFHVPDETRERAALFSLEFAGTFETGKEVIDNALTDMLTAIKTGDRAEAWYQMRYALNGNASTAAAREHFSEAQVFGLFASVNPQSRADVGTAELLLAMRMATTHANSIASYDTAFASQITLAVGDVNDISLRTKTNYGTVGTAVATLAPAFDKLVYDNTDLNHLAHDLDADLGGSAVLHNYTVEAVWVSPDATHTVDRGDHPAQNDLIFGSITNRGIDSGETDAVFGGEGDDFIVGSKGADDLDGGSGEDTVSYLASTRALRVDIASEISGSGGEAAGDTYIGIENVLGGSGDDRINGGFTANLLYGGAGADRLIGREGDDFLIGGSGADMIFGDALNQRDLQLNATARADLQHSGATLVGNLGGDYGFGETTLASSDDGSTGAIDISAVFGEEGLNFFGTNYTHLFVNNNGNITFSAGLEAYTPGPIDAGEDNPIIAAFWADVDTRGGEGAFNRVFYDLDSTHGIFTVTWNQVGYYNQHLTPNNSFQLQLIDEHNGNFDIVFRYKAINWTTGDASNGLIARAGYAAGNGSDYFELSQSGDDTQMRDLPDTEGNTGIDGLFVFHVINGHVFGADDTIDGGEGVDSLMGGPGADLFIFHAGEANGDVVQDFNEVSGDRLSFVGYGTDATFTQINNTHWQIGSDIITFANAAIINAGDYIIS